MRRKIAKLILLSCVIISSPFIAFAQNKNSAAFKKIKKLDEQLQTFPITSIKPTGWLKKQLQENLDGFAGHLDSLAPDLVVADDIYGKDRLTKRVKNKDVGAVSDGGEWESQFLWWNSETQSNWWDGYIRTAILLNDKKHLQKIKLYVNKILSTQDDDGYLGIYDKELRYHFDNENGELWSKATLLRGLLSWYDFEKDKNVLRAIQRAVDNVMVNYPINNSHPFYSVKPDVGGVTHGLTFTDVLERMFRLTSDQKYLDYCLFMYKDFSDQVLNEDAQYSKLQDTNINLKGHGVHTYEHLRSVAAAYYASGNPALKNAIDNFLKKINRTTTPSGAPAGDEYIGGRNADATSTGYEYCSLHELMDSYLDLFAKTGETSFGDKAEHLFFNAAQGSRHPEESAICYLKTDNAYFLTGAKNGDTSDKRQTRYRYSPVHKEAAVCCVPNAGRIGPYFVQNMWMKEKNALVATLLGPCEFATKLDGNTIYIKEETSYPFENSIRFVVNVEKPAKLILKIRKPVWAEKINCTLPYALDNGFIVLNKVWQRTTSFTISFEATPKVKKDNNGEYYFTAGPLVLAHPIESTEKTTKQFSFGGLKELEYSPVKLITYQYDAGEIKSIGKKDSPVFQVGLYNPQSALEENVNLVPMAKTILRQVTFKSK